MCGGLTICGNPTRKAAVATEGVRHNSFGNADLVTSTLFRAGPSWVSRDVHMLGKCRLDCVEKFMLHVANCCSMQRGREVVLELLEFDYIHTCLFWRHF